MTDQQAPAAALDSMFVEAVDHHRQGRHPEAERLYRAILSQQPAHPDANHNLGVLALQLGRPVLGLQPLRGALEAAPGQETFWVDYAEALLAAGEGAAALDLVKQAEALGRMDPARIDSLRQRGEESRRLHHALIDRYQSGDFSAAAKEAERFTEHWPGAPVGWVLLAACQQALGAVEKALHSASQAARCNPGDANIQAQLGGLLFGAGRLEEAEMCYRRALEIDSGLGEVHGNLGAVLQACGQVDEAERCYRKALENAPESAEILSNLGDLLREKGAMDEAVDCCRKALEIRPDFVQARLNLGNAMRAQGRLDEAEANYRVVLEQLPDYPLAHLNLAVVLRERGDLETAERAYRKSIELEPKGHQGHAGLGGLLLERGRPEEAERVLREALTLEEGDATSHCLLGDALKALGRPAEAALCYQTATSLKPDYSAAHGNLGAVLLDLGRLEEAEAAFLRALELEPDEVRFANNLGNVMKESVRLEEAERWYRRAVEGDPAFAEGHCNLGGLLDTLGRQEEALACYDRALALKPENNFFHSNRLYLLNKLESFHPLMEEGLRRWRECCMPERHPGSFANSRDPERVLRVGIVSPDLRRHSVAYFIEPLFRGRDRDAYRLYAYSDACNEDEVSERLRSHADHWCACFGWSDERLRRTILEDGIDILIDLAGHTNGNRLLLFGRRAAPVQLTYLGYGDLTGVPAMDYRITDGRADPPSDSADAVAEGEVLLRLPESFLCFEAPEEAPAVSDPPLIERGSVTFGSFNNLSKLTSEMVAVWAEILQRVPGSRLILKSRVLTEAGPRKRVESLFQAQGIDPSRLRLLGMIPDLGGHLALYGEVDVALDSYPYHGTTTSCEALWMGVPVVTLAGDRHISRVGASLLGGLGLDELVAGDEREYVEIAVALAGDPARLRELRHEMRARMRAAPLMDEAGFNRAMEGLFREVWKRWIGGEEREDAPRDH